MNAQTPSHVIAPYHVEFYLSPELENAIVDDESDPNPTLAYDAMTPDDIYIPITYRFAGLEDINYVPAPDLTPSNDDLLDAYHVYVNGHESSFGTHVGTMYVTSIS